MSKVYERVSNVRALEYSNGVSPFALWSAYLLFDMQFIIVQSKCPIVCSICLDLMSPALIVYGLLFVRPMKAIWYRPDCIFGAFILFGIASYLGTYLLSKIIRRGSFAASLGIHILLFVLYIISYVANEFGGSAESRQFSRLRQNPFKLISEMLTFDQHTMLYKLASVSSPRRRIWPGHFSLE